MTEPIVVADDVRDEAAREALPVDVERWAALATHCLVAEGVTGELTVTFVDLAEIAELNLEHLGKAGPTDVLSFPLDSADDPDQRASGVPLLLGDIVVSPEVARSQCADHAGTYDDEIALLVVHGVLHVLGHDHADAGEAEVMRARELTLLETFHWGGRAPAGFRQTHE